MSRILITAAVATLLVPSLCQAQQSAKSADAATAPPPAPVVRTGKPVNPRPMTPVAPATATLTAHAAPGVNASATVFTYRGASRPALSAPVFSYPQGWGYRHWAIGQSLPLLFLTSPYWFDDYSNLDIPPPRPGFRWVRYGPDLLLVNIRTGRIAEVIYGVFY